MTTKKDQARHDELAAIDWKTLWGIPAALAGVILVIFCLAFHERPDSDSTEGVGDTVATANETPPAEEGFQSTLDDVDDG